MYVPVKKGENCCSIQSLPINFSTFDVVSWTHFIINYMVKNTVSCGWTSVYVYTYMLNVDYIHAFSCSITWVTACDEKYNITLITHTMVFVLPKKDLEMET